MGQVSAVKKREAGGVWNDDEVFEGLVRSILTANTDWSKVEGVLPELSMLLHDFSLSWYAALPPGDVKQKLVPWFKERSAGSRSLSKNLRLLILSATQLRGISQRQGSVEAYLAHLSAQHDADPKAVAAALGEASSRVKLPGLGVALAAEFLKNVGYDLSKPDTHINRALGSFKLVRFANWDDRNGFGTPKAGKYELRTVMLVMENWAMKLGSPVTFLDNALWLLCARSGLHLSNSDLAALRLQVAPRQGDELIASDSELMDAGGLREASGTHTSTGMSDKSEQSSSRESAALSIPLALERTAKRLLASYGNRIPRGKLVDETASASNLNPKSIIPSDHCYNRQNKGSRKLQLFIWHPGAKYEYVGSNFKYDGPIIRELRKLGN